MSEYGFMALLVTALTVGVVHTLLGPDHYIPFIAMSKAGGWSWRKTLRITWLCGAAHVLSSVALGLFGVWSVRRMGVDAENILARLTGIESVRGDLAGWLLLAFGLAYTVWGARRAIRSRIEADPPVSAKYPAQRENHAPDEMPPAIGTSDSHRKTADIKSNMTGWALFTVFVFGPCEPLIPLMMAPTALVGWERAALLALVFGVATVATMTVLVAAGVWGVSALKLPHLQRYAHATAGALVVACGIAIQLGL